eukprot:764872-Hanusia_phi.AAC.4
MDEEGSEARKVLQSQLADLVDGDVTIAWLGLVEVRGGNDEQKRREAARPKRESIRSEQTVERAGPGRTRSRWNLDRRTGGARISAAAGDQRRSSEIVQSLASAKHHAKLNLAAWAPAFAESEFRTVVPSSLA